MTIYPPGYEFLRGWSKYDEMSVEGYTVHSNTHLAAVPQKPWHAHFGALFHQVVHSLHKLDKWFVLPFLFLDVNDIPANFSNCWDLICTSSLPAEMSVGDLEVLCHFKRRGKGVGGHITQHFYPESRFDGTVAAHCLSFFFSFLQNSFNYYPYLNLTLRKDSQR